MYAKSSGLERSVPAKKFLQSAKDTGDKSILQSARNWLQEQSLLSAKDAHDYEIKWLIVLLYVLLKKRYLKIYSPFLFYFVDLKQSFNLET